MFSYENQTKKNFENKENEFTIFNILYMNQKTCVVFLVFELNRKHGIVAIFFFSSHFVFYFDFLLIGLTKIRYYE